MIRRFAEAERIRNAPAAERPALEQQRTPAMRLDPHALLADLRTLTNEHKNRVFGSKEGLRASKWLAHQMKGLGLARVNDDAFHRFTSEVEGKDVPGRNVVGLLKGTDPKLAGEYVLVAAHHDTHPNAPEGANDNATGTAAVLAIARALAKAPPRRSVLFVTFDGEEGTPTETKYYPGRRGSRAYVANPVVPIEHTAMMVNLDELGQVHLESGSRKTLYGWASDDAFAAGALRTASQEMTGKLSDGYPEQPREAQFFTTDAEPAYRLGVPTVNFLSGRELVNHSPADAFGRIIPDRLGDYAQLALSTVHAAANEPRSLREMGIRPGGLKATYPLIQARLGLSTSVPAEEAWRLDTLHYRLPQFKRAVEGMIADLASPAMEKRGGFTWAELTQGESIVSEPTLHRLRELYADRVNALHDLPKAEIARRAEATQQLKVLAGLQQVLTGAIYISHLDTRSDYYVRQLPQHLRAFAQGARQLDLESRIRGLISVEDTRRFSVPVSTVRAVELARDLAGNVARAFSSAAYALLNPSDAAKTGRPLEEQDLEGAAAHPALPLLRATIELKALFSAEHNTLRPSTSLKELDQRLRALGAAAGGVEGGQGIASEAEFWSRWLQPYLSVEPKAAPLRAQTSALREQALRDAEALTADLGAGPEAKAKLIHALQTRGPEFWYGLAPALDVADSARFSPQQWEPLRAKLRELLALRPAADAVLVRPELSGPVTVWQPGRR
jgi:hypothetical protein